MTQRPAEIDPTILSQCNTVFALRMSNDRDQAIVQSSISDTGSGLMEFLPALGAREAIAFGEGVALPVRIRFDELPKSALPRSSSARFSEMWQKSVGDEGFLDQVVERWRHSSSGIAADQVQNMAMFAEAMGIVGSSPNQFAEEVAPARPTAPLADHARSAGADLRTPQVQQRRDAPTLRRDPRDPRENRPHAHATPPPAQPTAPTTQSDVTGGALRSLRDRLTQRR